MLDRVSPSEAALEHLLDKLSRWLVQQPEWPLVFNADRQTRKRAAQALAKVVLTIPAAEPNPVNRPLRRRITRELARQEREWLRGIEEE